MSLVSPNWLLPRQASSLTHGFRLASSNPRSNDCCCSSQPKTIQGCKQQTDQVHKEVQRRWFASTAAAGFCIAKHTADVSVPKVSTGRFDVATTAPFSACRSRLTMNIPNISKPLNHAHQHQNCSLTLEGQKRGQRQTPRQLEYIDAAVQHLISCSRDRHQRCWSLGSALVKLDEIGPKIEVNRKAV